MILCILPAAAGESGKVRIARSLPLARTEICAMLAFITRPSNLAIPGLGLGLTVLTMMGTAVSTTIGAKTGTGPCARAGEENPAASSNAAVPGRDMCLNSFIRDSFQVVGGDSQGLEKTHVLRGHG